VRKATVATLSGYPGVVSQGRQQYPLSAAQERMYFIEQLGTAGALFNIPFSWRIEGVLDIRLLERSVEALRERHASLRTRFLLDEDGPVQEVGAATPFQFGGGLVQSVSENGAMELEISLRDQVSCPFDLEAGPPFRTTLLRVRTDLHYMFLTLHHLVCDGWSREIVTRELGMIYSAFARGAQPSLKPIPRSYGEYVVEGGKPGARREELLEYWTLRLAGVPERITLPMDLRRPTVQDYRGAYVSFGVHGEVLEALRAAARAQRVTPYVILLATFALMLSQLTGADEVIIGSASSGRSNPELFSVVGCFTNILPLRIGVRRCRSVGDLWRHTRNVVTEALDREAPIDEIVAALPVQRHLAHTPLYQVGISLQNYRRYCLSLSGCATAELAPRDLPSPLDLSLHFREGPSELLGSMHYQTALFEHRTVRHWTERYEQLLRVIVCKGDSPLDGEFCNVSGRT
jgi:Condensation domain